MPPTANAMKIKWGVVYNPTFYHGYLLKNCHPGRRQPWPPPSPMGRPHPFCSRAHVDRAMGNAPYRQRHENLAGGVYTPTIHHGNVLQNNSSSWALPAMAPTAAYGPSAPAPLKGAR